MDPNGTHAFVLALLAAAVAILAGLAQLVVSVAMLLRVAKMAGGLNGRLDQLLSERELRLRAEHQVAIERARSESAGDLGRATRPDPVIVHLPSAPPD